MRATRQPHAEAAVFDQTEGADAALGREGRMNTTTFKKET
jgi:hypothetical protein